MLRAGLFGVEADDAVDDLFACVGTVESAGVAAEPEHLPGAGEQAVVAGYDADRAEFGASVPAAGGDISAFGELGVAAGQQGLGGLHGEPLVPLQDQQMVGVQRCGDQPGGLCGVQGVQSQQHAGHFEGVSRGSMAVVSPRLSATCRWLRITAR